MTVRAPVAPEVIAWALDRSGVEVEAMERQMPRLLPWLHGDEDRQPTFVQVQTIAKKTGVPLGYLFLPRPPNLELPIPDFRDGFAGPVGEPSVDLLAVVNASALRQDWYRDYAEANGLEEIDIVGRGAGMSPAEAASDMRSQLDFSVTQRSGRGGENRRHLLDAFERLGGLTVATSMVGNNTSRLLDADEFRGFTLADPLAPLIFVNTHQTLNAQLFTIGHELAHVWRASTGVSREEPGDEGRSGIEQWCNQVAAEFLVPHEDLLSHYPAVADLALTDQLEHLAKVFRCGTLVILQAMRRDGVRAFDDFNAAYGTELERLLELAEGSRGAPSGGDYWASQRYRIGSRLATALAHEAAAGHTPTGEAVRLSGLGSLGQFQEMTRRLGVR